MAPPSRTTKGERLYRVGELHGCIESLEVIDPILTEPERVEAIAHRPTLGVVEVFVEAVVGSPPRSTNPNRSLFRAFDERKNLVHDVAGTSLDILVRGLVDPEQHLDVLANVVLIEVPTSEEPVLFRSRFKLSVDIIHDISHVVEIALARTCVTNPNERTLFATVGSGKGVHAHDTDRRIATRIDVDPS